MLEAELAHEKRRGAAVLRGQFYANQGAVLKTGRLVMPAIRRELEAMADCDALVVRLRERSAELSTEEKRALWQELKNVAVAKAMAVVYVVSLTITGLVVVFNLIGRYVGSESNFDAPVAQLPGGSLTRETQQRLIDRASAHAVDILPSAVVSSKNAVEAVLCDAQLSEVMSHGDIMEVLKQCRAHIESHLHFQALLSKLEENSAQDNNLDVLIREFRDIVESPDFGEVWSDILESAFQHLGVLLLEAFGAEKTAKIHLAKIIPKLVKVGGRLLDIDDPACLSGCLVDFSSVSNLGAIVFLSGEKDIYSAGVIDR